MQQLKNEYLTVAVNELGAEITSVKTNNDNVEYIWQADPEYWGRHAPVLFPIVGRLKDDAYQLNGKTYHMTQHGFARDQTFEVVEHDDDHVLMSVVANDETLAQYPFDFTLQVLVQLHGHNVNVDYIVKNNGDDDMPYSIGAHPGFNVPLHSPRAVLSDYQVTVAKRKAYQRIPLVGPYNDVADAEEMDLSKPLPLSRELFKNDAQILSLEDEETTVMLSSQYDDHSVAVTINHAPYVGIWSPYPKEAPFICIEPWWGIADNVDHDGEFTHKMGIRTLEAKAEEQLGFQLTFF